MDESFYRQEFFVPFLLFFYSCAFGLVLFVYIFTLLSRSQNPETWGVVQAQTDLDQKRSIFIWDNPCRIFLLWANQFTDYN